MKCGGAWLGFFMEAPNFRAVDLQGGTVASPCGPTGPGHGHHSPLVLEHVLDRPRHPLLNPGGVGRRPIDRDTMGDASEGPQLHTVRIQEVAPAADSTGHEPSEAQRISIEQAFQDGVGLATRQQIPPALHRAPGGMRAGRWASSDGLGYCGGGPGSGLGCWISG